MNTDPIADLLTRIRNAVAVGKSEVSLPYSKVKHAIANTIADKGFVESVSKDNSGTYPELKIKLKDVKNRKLSLQRVSKPGQRIYVKSQDIRKIKNGLGIAIISTSQGIMTGDEARQKKLGGEIICEVY